MDDFILFPQANRKKSMVDIFYDDDLTTNSYEEFNQKSKKQLPFIEQVSNKHILYNNSNNSKH